MVKFAMQEAKRLGLQLGMHVSDGFALAGGPWITPSLSMQKLVWTKTYVTNGNTGKINLEQPEAIMIIIKMSPYLLIPPIHPMHLLMRCLYQLLLQATEQSTVSFIS
jgi:hypothetical protein